ncbi:MAG: hypothetical protein LC105_05150 [Chitinophagales bacterium]|nr:hypothetical protein [Chitinophagales bacterium]MCZ2393223.1 hypothetical protein [Chitinophagales bacterium]
MKAILKIIFILILTAFGLLTLFMSSSVLFDWFGIREKEGNYVPFVVWANWLCGFLYLIAAYGISKRRLWTLKPLSIAIIILIVTFIVLSIYIYSGGIYETKTVYAMTFRIILTLIFILVANLSFKMNRNKD